MKKQIKVLKELIRIVEDEYTDSSVVTEVTEPEKEYQMIHLNSSKKSKYRFF